MRHTYTRFDNKNVTATNLRFAILEPRVPGDGVSMFDPIGGRFCYVRGTPMGAVDTHQGRGGKFHPYPNPQDGAGGGGGAPQGGGGGGGGEKKTP